MAQRKEPPAQPQRTQSAEEFWLQWCGNSKGLYDHLNRRWSVKQICNFAEAYGSGVASIAALLGENCDAT